VVSDDIVMYLRLSRTRFNRHAEAADEIERLRARVNHWKLMYETALKLYYNEHGRLPNE